jgi:hypothetical protein
MKSFQDGIQGNKDHHRGVYNRKELMSNLVHI